MKTRFRLIRRNMRGGKFYPVDTLTVKRTSLGTQHEDEAIQLIQAKNQATRQPVLNLHIAKEFQPALGSKRLIAIIATKEGEVQVAKGREGKSL